MNPYIGVIVQQNFSSDTKNSTVLHNRMKALYSLPMQNCIVFGFRYNVHYSDKFIRVDSAAFKFHEKHKHLTRSIDQIVCALPAPPTFSVELRFQN